MVGLAEQTGTEDSSQGQFTLNSHLLSLHSELQIASVKLLLLLHGKDV